MIRSEKEKNWKIEKWKYKSEKKSSRKDKEWKVEKAKKEKYKR